MLEGLRLLSFEIQYRCLEGSKLQFTRTLDRIPNSLEPTHTSFGNKYSQEIASEVTFNHDDQVDR